MEVMLSTHRDCCPFTSAHGTVSSGNFLPSAPAWIVLRLKRTGCAKALKMPPSFIIRGACNLQLCLLPHYGSWLSFSWAGWSRRTCLISTSVWFSKNRLIVGRNLGQVSKATCTFEEATGALTTCKSYSKLFIARSKGIRNHPGLG